MNRFDVCGTCNEPVCDCFMAPAAPPEKPEKPESLPPSQEEHEELGEVFAKRYARELGGWPKGTAIASVNGHTRGWDDCLREVVTPLQKELEKKEAYLVRYRTQTAESIEVMGKAIELRDQLQKERDLLREALKEAGEFLLNLHAEIATCYEMSTVPTEALVMRSYEEQKKIRAALPEPAGGENG